MRRPPQSHVQNTMAEELYAVIAIGVRRFCWRGLVRGPPGAGIDHVTVLRPTGRSRRRLGEEEDPVASGSTSSWSPRSPLLSFSPWWSPSWWSLPTGTSDRSLGKAAAPEPTRTASLHRPALCAGGIRGRTGPRARRDVVSGQVIRQSWEDVTAVIAGARTGKTLPGGPRHPGCPGCRLHLFEQARCRRPHGSCRGRTRPCGSSILRASPTGIRPGGEPTRHGR